MHCTQELLKTESVLTLSKEREAEAKRSAISYPATSAPGLGSILLHIHRHRAHPCHICAGTGLHPSHICAGTELAPATSSMVLRYKDRATDDQKELKRLRAEADSAREKAEESRRAMEAIKKSLEEEAQSSALALQMAENELKVARKEAADAKKMLAEMQKTYERRIGDVMTQV